MCLVLCVGCGFLSLIAFLAELLPLFLLSWLLVGAAARRFINGWNRLLCPIFRSTAVCWLANRRTGREAVVRLRSRFLGSYTSGRKLLTRRS